MKLRIAAPEDAGALLEIYRPYVENTACSFEYEAPTVAEFERRIRDTIPRYPYLVAEEEKEILGYAYAAPFHHREAYQHGTELSVYVRTDRRRAGVGRLLYQELERLLKGQNIHVLYACIASTDRAEDPFLNDDSIRFHKSCGFQTVSRFTNCGYKFDRWYHVVWMEKRICLPMDAPPPFVPFSELKREPLKFAVSACLLGDNCKYNGGNNFHEQLSEALKGHTIIRICPEVRGGLPIPRVPVELVDGIAVNRDGKNVHAEFMLGADRCLKEVLAQKVDAVIVQPRSPSCGKDTIYDGTFTGTLTSGHGLFVQRLLEAKIPVFTVEEFLAASGRRCSIFL